MTIQLTPDQASASLKALCCRLNYMQSLRLRLLLKTATLNPSSERIWEVTKEIVNLQLAISALEEAMLRR